MATSKGKQAYSRGMSDYASGVPLHECPYWDPDLAGKWRNGWHRGEAKTRKRRRN